jgi:hypothetical protein
VLHIRPKMAPRFNVDHQNVECKSAPLIVSNLFYSLLTAMCYVIAHCTY